MSIDIEKIKEQIDTFEKNLGKNKQIRKLQKSVPFPLTYAIAGAVVFILFLIYLFSGVRAITTMVAVVYPAYRSMQAIRSDNKDDDTLWLAYWVWYGIFTLVESVTDLLLFWIPMYELLKMAFYVYLYAPQMKGALFLYNKLLAPLIVQMESMEQRAKGAASDVKQAFSSAQDETTTTKKGK